MMVSENHFPTGPIRQFIEQISGLEKLRKQKRREFNELTEREIEVLTLVATGKKNPAIAEELEISRTTVQNHRAQVRDKLNIKSQTGYIKCAMVFGLIEF